MRYLNMSDLTAIYRMTFYEYRLRMKAHALQQLDEERLLYIQAWLNREVEAKKKKGKDRLEYVYKKMVDFFDYDKREREILYGKGDLQETASTDQTKRYAEYMRRKKDGEL